jgi:ATP-dependent helicase YprA (DUF1998 family)
MLDLMLTRPLQRPALITSAKNLSFLVLEELHTYRGRQGADVAMLVRRLGAAVTIRQRLRISSSELPCAAGVRGATIDADGGRPYQQALTITEPITFSEAL